PGLPIRDSTSNAIGNLQPHRSPPAQRPGSPRRPPASRTRPVFSSPSRFSSLVVSNYETTFCNPARTVVDQFAACQLLLTFWSTPRYDGNFYQRTAWQLGDLHDGPGREVRAEIRLVHLVHGAEILDVLQVDRGGDDIRHREP